MDVAGGVDSEAELPGEDLQHQREGVRRVEGVSVDGHLHRSSSTGPPPKALQGKLKHY